jgi:hypothetical protein
MALRDYFNFGKNFGKRKREDALSPGEKERLFKVRQTIYNALEGKDTETQGKTEKVGISDLQDFAGIGDFSGMMNIYSKYIYQSEASKQQRLEIYREMAKFPEIGFAIDEYVDEAINFDKSGTNFCKIEITNNSIKENEHARKTINAEFDHLMYEIIKADETVDTWFREFMIDGEIALENCFDNDKPEKGITKVKKLMTTRIHPIWDDLEAEDISFYAYRTDKEVISLPKNAISYAASGIANYDSTEQDKLILSFLEQAKTTYRRLKLMEDALVIYRLVRAPERRIFKIDVGNMPKGKAEHFVQELMTKYRQRKFFDPKTGDVSEGLDAMAMTEDFWFPVFQGGRSSEVTSLPGGQGLGEIADVDYFLNKLYRGLKIPKSRWGGEEGKFSIGDTQDITREEVKFVKEVKRFSKRFVKIYKQTFITHLKLKGIWEEFGLEEKDISLQMFSNNLFDKFFEAKILELKFENFSKFADLIDTEDPIFSTELIVKDYLEMDDDKWDEHVEKRIAERQAKKLLKDDEEGDSGEEGGDKGGADSVL